MRSDRSKRNRVPSEIVLSAEILTRTVVTDGIGVRNNFVEGGRCNPSDAEECAHGPDQAEVSTTLWLWP